MELPNWPYCDRGKERPYHHSEVNITGSFTTINHNNDTLLISTDINTKGLPDLGTVETTKRSHWCGLHSLKETQKVTRHANIPTIMIYAHHVDIARSNAEAARRVLFR